MRKRVLSIICIAVITACQFAFLLPWKAFAETPGADLVIRVGYMGDYKDYRIKATLTRAQLESLPQQTNRYTNVTNTGTVKSLIARGPTMSAVLQEAGIDMNSVHYIDVRTKDGKGTDGRYLEDRKSPTYLVKKFLNGGRYYYPNLENNWENRGRTGMPLKGALAGKREVASILAIESSNDEVKKPENGAEGWKESDMGTDNSYRFCVGQTALTEGVETSNPTDVTSSRNAKWIYGVDVTLLGSPIDKIKIDLDKKNLVVGSKMQAKLTITGNELFKHKLGGKNIAWSSSNPAVASIDNKGMITFKKKGSTTISAKNTATGNSFELGINVTDKKSEKQEEKNGGALVKKNSDDSKDTQSKKATEPQKQEKKPVKVSDPKKDAKKDTKAKKKLKKVAVGVEAKEISLGEEVGTAQYTREDMGKDATALSKQEAEPAALLVAGVTGAIFFCGGIVLRIDRYFREV